MAEQLVIEVTRGSRVESRHAVSLAVRDASGGPFLDRGRTGEAVFPRSAVKVFQAIPLIESGAADAFELGDRELALACASHSGEEGHASLASKVLRRADLDETALECGCHWPFEQSVALALAASGRQPTALHNNCSGKHAGFLCTAVHLGEPTAGYVGIDHPVQRRVRAAIEDLTGTVVGETECGIDGCAIPTYAAPLESFAQGFAKLVSGEGVGAERSAAGRRLIAACMSAPWEMSGTGRACLRLMEAAPGRVFAKTGAEGVFCGAVPEFGLGFALKCEDGATRASEAAAAVALADIFRRNDAPDVAERFDALSRRTFRNWNGTVVGAVRPAAGS